MRKKKILWAMAAILSGLAASPAGAGNEKMIGKRIVELDRLNRQVVGRLPDLPRDGQVSFKGRVLPDGTPLEPAWTHALAKTPVPRVDDTELATLSEAIGQYRQHPSQIRSYRDANTDRAYTPLAVGLRQRYAIGRSE